MAEVSQGIFPWSRSVPYEWSPWFAWYPVRTTSGRYRMGWMMVRAHGDVAPNGDLTDWMEYDAGR